MTNIDGWSFLPPRDETVWERWVQILLTKKFQRPATAYGRKGQGQRGLDFVVNSDHERIGIQCKHVSLGSKLNITQVEDDVAECAKVEPKIDRFILYTSAASDATSVDKLSALAQRVRQAGMQFEFYMWRDFEAEIQQYDLVSILYDGLAEKFAGSILKPSSGTPSLVDSGHNTGGPSVLSSEILDAVKTRMAQGDIAGAKSMVEFVISTAASLTDGQLATAYSSKAILLSRECKSDEAAKYWRRAAEVEPTSPKVHARKAHALICEGEYGQALEEALQGLSSQQEVPPPALAAVAAVISASHEGRLSEIEARLSARLKADRDVMLVRAHGALTAGDLPLAEQLCEQLARDYPEDYDAICIRADVLFQRALGGRHHVLPGTLTETSRQALSQALGLYEKAVKARDPILEQAAWLPAALNQLSVLKLLEDHVGAARVAERILEKHGAELDDYPRLLLALAEGGHSNRVIALTDGAIEPLGPIGLARASALLHTERYGEAISLLDAVLDRTCGLDADNVRWLKIWAMHRSQPTADLTQLVDAYYEQADDKISASRRIMEATSRMGLSSLSTKYAQLAVERCRAEPDPDHATVLADALIILDDLDGAIENLLPLVDLTHPQAGPLEERLAFCLLRRYRFETLSKLLNGLQRNGLDTARFAAYRASYHISRGDPEQALSAVQHAIALAPTDMPMRTQEVWLLREMGHADTARQKLAEIPYRAECPLKGIALYLRESYALDRREQGDDFLYRWIRDNARDPESVAWFIGEFLISRADAHIPLHKTVTTQCGVCLQSKLAKGTTYWIVIDDRLAEDVSLGWHTPRSQGVANLLGKAPRDEVEFPGFPGGPFKIRRITSVLDGTAQVLMSRYGKDMPMAESLRYLTMPIKDGEPDPQPILQHLDLAKEQTLNALSFYNEQLLPLGVLASAMQRNPIDVWLGLIGTEEHRVKAELPGLRMKAEAGTNSEAIRPCVVVDPVVLFSWAVWDLLPTATRCAPSICIPATSMNVLREKRAALTMFGSGPQMVLASGRRPGTYQRTDITPAARQFEAALFDRLLAWIDVHVEIVPVPTTGIPEATYSALRGNSGAYLADQFQLAAHRNATLVADDAGLQVLATSLHVAHASTRAFFLGAVQLGLLSRTRYAAILSKLTNANYEFVSYSSHDLLAASSTTGYAFLPELTDELVSMVRYLRTPTLNVPSGLRMFFVYLGRLNDVGVDASFVSSVTTLALGALTRHATRQTIEIAKAFLRVATELLEDGCGAAVNDALRRWCAGHMIQWEKVTENEQPLLKPTT